MLFDLLVSDAHMGFSIETSFRMVRPNRKSSRPRLIAPAATACGHEGLGGDRLSSPASDTVFRNWWVSCHENDHSVRKKISWPNR